MEELIVNTRQMKYFSKVFEMENMTKAAAALHIAQPALTQQIQLLEESLGVILFTRSTRGAKPTSEGTRLYKHVQTILRQIDNTKAVLGRMEHQVSGTVAIAMPSSTAKMLALPLIKEVKKLYPSIILEIVDMPSAILTKQVLQGRVDFSLTPDQEQIQGMIRKPFLLEDLLLLIHPEIAIKKARPEIEDIQSLPLILPSLPNKLRSRIDHEFLLKRIPYDLMGEASTSAILVPAVKAGIAATILPYSAAHEEIQNKEIQMKRFNFPFVREIYLCYNSSALLHEAIECVMTVCMQVAKDLIDKKIWKYTKLLSDV